MKPCTRRAFVLQTAGLAASAFIANGLALAVEPNSPLRKQPMNGNYIHNHFASLRAWHSMSTVDGIKVGDPATEIRGIAVMWKPRLRDIRKAHDLGCNFILGHESVFCEGGNGDETSIVLPAEKPKHDYLMANGIVCYRCHDAWDVAPEVGVRDSWAKGLGYALTPPLANYSYMRSVDAGGIEFAPLCSRVLGLVRSLGQQTLIASGNPHKLVHRLTISTGATNDVNRIMQTQPDACIVSDDYFRFVRDGVLLDEAEVPFMVLNHGTMEEGGIQSLFKYAQTAFAPIPVHFFPQGCTYRVVTSDDAK